MVTDVEMIETLANRRDHPWMAVSEVENAAVAVAVPVPATAVGIAKAGSLALTDDDLHPERLESPHLATVDVCGELGRCLLPRRIGLLRGADPPGCIHHRPPVG